MKKFFFLLVLALILALSLNVYAGEIDLVGGLTQNNMGIRFYHQNGNTYTYPSYFSGIGYYLGARYWFNPKFGVGIGYDHWEAYWGEFAEDDYPYKYYWIQRLTGPYLEAVYSINDFFNISGTVASYQYLYIDGFEDSTTPYEEEVWEEGAGTGLGLKAEMEYPVLNNLNLLASAGYKTCTVDIVDNNDKYNVFGFSYSLGLSYDF